MNYGATLNAEVAPYIEASTNDARVTATVRVTASRTNNCRNGGFFVGTPVVTFGDGNVANNFYNSAVPGESTVRIDRPGDGFENGTYLATGNDGAAAFDLAFGVSAGGAGIAFSQTDDGPIILLPTDDDNKIIVGNKVYTDNAGTRWRGGFRNGGSFTLSDFVIRTGDDSQSEFGNVIIRIPVYEARITTLVFNQTSKQVGVLDTELRYVRGDYLREPKIEVIADRRVIGLGESVDVRVRVRNDSNLSLKAGDVILNPASAGGVVSSNVTVQEFSSMPSNLTREVVFTVTGEQVGVAPLQFTVTGGWVSPVPPGRIYEQVLELAGGLEVVDGVPPLFQDGFEAPGR
ncbi:MAG: hypothetical protein V2I57_05340 [Xanthomonadales bacterium]|nr:hypothetical protein [Xanthomonadales bacterium]